MSVLSLLPRLGRQQVHIASSYFGLEPDELLDQLRTEALAAAREELDDRKDRSQTVEVRVNEVIRQVNLPEFESVLTASRARLRAAYEAYDPTRVDETWPAVLRARAEVELLESLENLSG